MRHINEFPNLKEIMVFDDDIEMINSYQTLKNKIGNNYDFKIYSLYHGDMILLN